MVSHFLLYNETMGVMSNMRNKFIKIYDDLSNQIINREIEAETLLPSENELAETYSSSRETIRKALNKLSEDGYIHKVQALHPSFPLL